MRFENISEKQMIEDLTTEQREAIFTALLPKRATVGSAGYDFFCPYDVTIARGQTIKIPTLVRAKLDEGQVLLMVPRSGLGFRTRIQLVNTIGVIDEDYYNSDNEGHIWVKLYLPHDSDVSEVTINRGEAMCQGIVVNYAIAENDLVTEIRNGGLGSTTKK